MKKEMLFALAIVCTCGPLLEGCAKAVAKNEETAGPVRKDIQLTVYKEDFAVVKEDRPVSLDQGVNKLGLLEVSKSLDQDSVMFSWPSSATKPEVLSSTYDLGIAEGSSLLKQFLGKPVDLVRYGQDGKEADRQHGILEVADAGDVVINCDGKYLINPQGSIEAPAGGIATIPQLSAEVQSPTNEHTDLGLTYLTRGLSWNADYVATLPPNGNDMKLEVWASITNQTGTSYPQAKISFVAGSPNRAAVPAASKTIADDDFQGGALAKRTIDSRSLAYPAPKPEAMGELYAYPMKSTASIQPNQQNRVKMLHSDSVDVKKDYSIALPGLGGYYSDGDDSNPDQRYSTTLAIRFKNTDQNGLGVPLPDGAVRVYEPTKDGSLAYIGASEITDTPSKAGVYLTLSKVFDVYAQRKITARKKLDKRTWDVNLEIPVWNEKASAADVRLVVPIYGNWSIASQSDPSKKLDSQSNQWTVHLNPGQQKLVKATIRMKY